MVDWHVKLGDARLIVSNKWPWLHSAVLQLLPVESKGLGTIAVTDKGVLMVDPDALDRWTPDQLAGGLVHEVSHLLREHGDRCRALSADPRLFNWASDLEINDDIVAAGWQLPDGCLYPKDYGFPPQLLAEEYYTLLQKDADACSGAGDNDDVGSGWCGSCAGRHANHEAERQATADADGGRSKADLNAIRRTVAAAIKQEAEKGRGTMPAGWNRWSEDYLKPPKVNWNTKLRRVTRGHVQKCLGAVNSSYFAPSRRQAGVGYGVGKPRLAKMYATKPLVAVCVDTSGSMGHDDLSAAISETNGVLKSVSAEALFLAIDCDVSDPIKKITKIRDVAKLLKGGGGTDFRPAFKALERMNPKERPNVIVYMTDGGGVAPFTAPKGVTVIWVLIGKHAVLPTCFDDGEGDQRTHKPLDWGDIVWVDAEAEERAARYKQQREAA